MEHFSLALEPQHVILSQTDCLVSREQMGVCIGDFCWCSQCPGWGGAGNGGIAEFTCIIRDNLMGFSGGSDGKESACNAGDLGLIPG